MADAPVLHAASLERGGARGEVRVTRATWEEAVVGRPLAKLAIEAPTADIARTLAHGALVAGANADVVLMSARVAPGHEHVEQGLRGAGFHVGSETLVLRADMSVVAPKVAQVPLRGTFREATDADADAVADIASRAFTGARYMTDPHFPPEWGAKIYAAWGRALVTGAADAVIVAEHRGTVIGFNSMSLDYANRAPGLLAVEPKYDGRGIGVMLARCFFDWYRERGLTTVELRTEKANAAVNALYLRFGLEITGGETTYHASPALPPLRERLLSGTT